jgi:5-methylcytosine-specific restriction endonuclease McrA
MEEVLQKLRELYPKTQIVIWEKFDRGKLFADDHLIVKFNINMLERQLNEGKGSTINQTIKFFAEYIEIKYLRRQNQFTKKKGYPAYNFTSAQIEFANTNTPSCGRAAEFLGVSYTTYRKYARNLGMFEEHKKKSGKGIRRWTAKPLVPIQDIFNGKHPNYDKMRLKQRLIREMIIPVKCEICGYDKHREEDKKIALMLDYIDGNDKNLSRENLRFLCYNCTFNIRGKLNIKFAKRIANIAMEKLLNSPIDNEPEYKEPENKKYDDIFDQFNKKVQ